jgi:hypothetical protein
MKGGEGLMRKWVSIILALVILAVFSFGCAGVQKDAKIKCPKCGAVFTVEEGLQEIGKTPSGAPAAR